MTKRRAERRHEQDTRDFVLLSNLRFYAKNADAHGDELLARTVADAADRIEALTHSRARVIEELKTTKWTLKRVAHGLDQQTRAFAGWVLDVQDAEQRAKRKINAAWLDEKLAAERQCR